MRPVCPTNLFCTRIALSLVNRERHPLFSQAPITFCIVYSRRKSCFPSALYSSAITGTKMDLQVQIQLNSARMCLGYGWAQSRGKLD